MKIIFSSSIIYYFREFNISFSLVSSFSIIVIIKFEFSPFHSRLFSRLDQTKTIEAFLQFIIISFSVKRKKTPSRLQLNSNSCLFTSTLSDISDVCIYNAVAVVDASPPAQYRSKCIHTNQVRSLTAFKTHSVSQPATANTTLC